MVNIECTRCGATGSGFETLYTANFGLTHERGCGTRIGISKYSNVGEYKKIEGKSAEHIKLDESPKVQATLKAIEETTVKPKKIFSFKKKSKKKKKRDD